MHTSSSYAAVVNSNSKHRWFTSGMALVWAFAVAKLVLHVYFNDCYGYFRDEFDYMACGNHLAWGYVDQPPLIPFLVHLSRSILGDSLRSIRFVPALASSFLVVQTALIAREFGGRRFALALSAIAAALAPIYLSDGSLFTTNCLEPNLWMGCAYCAILAIKRGDPRYWLWFGVIAGIGLEEKYTMALFGFAVVVGLVLTKQRRAFAAKWIWLGGLAAFLIFLPNLLWNIHYHWPFLQLMHNIRAETPRRRALSGTILPPGEPSDRPRRRTGLAGRSRRAVRLVAAKTVSAPGLDLPRLLRGVVFPAWKDLLPGSHLSPAVGGRSSRLGKTP